MLRSAPFDFARYTSPRTWSGVQRDQALDRKRLFSRRRRAVAGCRIILGLVPGTGM